MKIRFALSIVMMTLAPMVVPSVVGPSAAAEASGERIALGVGNAKYPDAEAPLKEPINDAHDVADELKRDGFDVEIGENMSGDAMRRALDKLYKKIKPGS